MQTLRPNIFKIAVIGDGGIGKSSLLRAHKDHVFYPDNDMTIGVNIECVPFSIELNSNKLNTLMAVDLGGQERFQFMHDAYLRGIKAAFVVYDLSRFKSYMHIEKFISIIRTENSTIPIFLVGTKSDLVPPEKIEQYKSNWDETVSKIENLGNFQGHFITSSKLMEGLDELFIACETVLQQVYMDLITPNPSIVALNHHI